MKLLSSLFKKIQLSQVTPTLFTIFISLYAVFLLLGAYYFLTTITIIIILPFIMISAYRWEVIGGILSSIWSVILVIFSSVTHHHTLLQDLIVSLSSYLVIGLMLVILYNYFESQNLKLKESENLYRQLFEQANDAILIVDNEGNIVNCNNVASNLIGYSRNQLMQPVHSPAKPGPRCNYRTKQRSAGLGIQGHYPRTWHHRVLFASVCY